MPGGRAKGLEALEVRCPLSSYSAKAEDRWEIPKPELFLGVAAHFDYDPEWTNQKRVFEIQPIKMIVVKMRSTEK